MWENDQEHEDGGFEFEIDFGSQFGDEFGEPYLDESESPAATKVRPDVERETDTKKPWLWNVVLLDDDHHTYDYVIRMVMEIFGKTIEGAFLAACTVDSDGRVVLLTTHKEHAELKRDQVHAFGKDALIAGCAGSMTAVLEPALADEGGDEGGEEDGAEARGSDHADG